MRFSTPAEYQCELCSRDLLTSNPQPGISHGSIDARSPQAKLPQLDPSERTTRRAVTNRPHHERKS